MTKRFAIIIESGNVTGQEDLPGARKDASNWEAFLKSNAGGAWRPDEIVVLHKPKSVDVSILNIIHKTEYVFLVFSGHGEEVFDRTTRQYSTRVCLNEKELSVDVKNLAPSRFGTAIFDCCRGVDNGLGSVLMMNEFARGGRGTLSFGMFSAKEAVDHGTIESRKLFNATEEDCRQIFMTELAAKQSNPTVRMYSCSKNEGAGEDPSAGGFYTTLLINGAEKWFEAQKMSRIYGVYSTKDAHDYAVEAMRARNPQQHPEYTPCEQSYPFAVG